MPELRITLLSPLCTSSGVGRPGYVDRDVVFDAYGLPLIPARRLKGLLRDAWKAVADCGLLALTEEDMDRVFGKTGQTNAGCLQVRDARLKQAGQIGSWLRWMGAYENRPFTREDVIAHYSGIRRQTMIDRKHGRAKENTLRATRVLEPETCKVFVAQVEGLSSKRDQYAFALAACALQQMGSSRHRGWGLVRCEYYDDNARKLKLDALQLLALEGGTLPALGEMRAAYTTLPARAAGNEKVQAFWLELKDGVLVPRIGGDPFTVLTHESIPGSVVQGALAAQYLGKHGAADQRFEELFCGGVRFLPAHAASGKSKTRLFPVPHSVRKKKHFEEYVDLAFEECDEPLKRSGGWANLEELWSGANATRVTVKTDLQYHHQRSKDRRRQRAMGQEADNADDRGAFFTYESIRKGQEFSGAIVGPDGDLDLLRGLIPEGAAVELGRSRKTQYGQAVWHWQGDAAPLIGWHEVAAPKNGCKRMLVTLLSPMIAVNANGHIAPRFPVEELAAALGLPAGGITPVKSFIRTAVTGGYLSHQRLPRQQTPSLEAGSVFVFDSADEISAEVLDSAQRASYGLRQESGFGRIAIRPEEPFNEDGSLGLGERFRFKDGEPVREVKPEKLQDGVRALAKGIFKTQLRSHAEALAVELAMHPKLQWKNVKPHLIARLKALLDARTLEEFAHLFDPIPARKEKKAIHGEYLRDSARSQLCAAVLDFGGTEAQKLFGNEKKLFLLEFLQRTSGQWKPVFEGLATGSFRKTKAWIDEFETSPLLAGGGDDAYSRGLVKAFLARFLGVLAQMHRKERKSGGGNANATR